MRSLSSDCEYIYLKTGIFLDKFKDKTIFITGGTGFIGKWFLEYFSWLNDNKNACMEIIVLSRNPSKFISDFPHFARNYIIYYTGDVIDFCSFDRHVDYIIHAATDSDAETNKNFPLKMVDTAVLGTRRILDFAVEKNVKCLLYLSSGAVYGTPPENELYFEESSLGAPDVLDSSSAYGESKRMAELLCKLYFEQFRLKSVIARCFAFVGPYLPLDKHFAIGNFINNVLRHEDIIIKGTGMPLRSYMYASDLIVWLLYCLFKGEGGTAYNVGSDQPVSIKDLAEITASFNSDLTVKVLNQTNTSQRNFNYIPDTSKIRSDLHVPEVIALKEAISRTINFYSE